VVAFCNEIKTQMKKHQEEANTLFKMIQNQENTRSIYLDRINNHAVRANFSNETLYLEHNIGGMRRPTKTEASILLKGLVNYCEALCQDNLDLATFLAEKRFVAELVVFSGQMDLKIASWEKEIITWHTELDG
jgi:hypothetical protein